MPFMPISNDLKKLLDENVHLIKEEYITFKMFGDSAIRAKLRAMGVDAGQDEIIPHLEKLEASKQRHLDKQKIKKLKARHKLRVARNKKKLDNIK